jgi:anti-sigma B factor antagonist
MDFDVRQERGVSIITASGELDAAKSPELEKVFASVPADASNRIVLDLKDTGFIDSSGLATLVRAFKRARSSGGNLVLAGLQPPVRKVFELTRLDKAFDIYGDTAEALTKLAK